MSEGLGLRQGTLALVAHDTRWARAFAEEARVLAAALPDGSEIHHIGSTAIPGLIAKPILDIGATVAGVIDDLAEGLTMLGYLDRGERSGRLFVRMRESDIRTHNLHVYAPDDARLLRQLAFRDRLRADPALRDAYGAAKRAILDRGTRRRDYAEAKTDFIAAALR